MILDTHMETPEEIKEPLRIIHKKKWKFGETRKRLNKNEELLKRLKKELGQE